MPKVYDAQGNYLHDAEPMSPADPPPTEPSIEDKVAAVITAVAAIVDDRPHDAAAAIAIVTTEGTTP